LRFWERPERRPRCRFCSMIIEPGEPAEHGHHRECCIYIQAKAAGQECLDPAVLQLGDCK
jgi:hypothetical protein